MEAFLKEIIENNKFELIIDTGIFSKDIILKAAYQFLDRGYFFFKKDKNWNIILQFTAREWNKEDPKNIIADFSDELLAVYLRDNLEKENKEIREKIVWVAITNSLDGKNFISIDTNNQNNNQEQNQIDFDKNIDEILKEIENDPELKIDEEETESELESETPAITVDPEAVKKAKEQFKK